jgi:hypothetical protein
VAAYRVSKIRTPLGFPARVENRDAFTQGRDAESKEDFIARIGLDTAGFSVNSSEAVRNAILSQVAGVSDCAFVKPHQDANKIIVYHIGSKVISTAVEGSTGSNPSRIIKFPENQTPIRFVEAVVLNGVALDPQDYTHDGYRLALSPSITLQPNQSYAISFQYNGLNQDISSFLASTADVHQTQWVPKEATPVPLNIQISLRMPSFHPSSDVAELAIRTVTDAVNQGRFVETLSASALSKAVLDASSDILACNLTINGQAFAVFAPGQYPTTSSDLISVVDL